MKERKQLPCNLFLIGFMGSGKSSIASHLRQTYGMTLLEMDEEIERREGQSISDIFKSKGEDYFRSLETSLLADLQGRENTVVSCGGGVPLRECNVELMKKSGKIILLTAEPQTILQRVWGSHSRPLLEGRKNVAHIRKMMEERRPYYEKAADLVLSTDGKNQAAICQELLERMQCLIPGSGGEESPAVSDPRPDPGNDPW